MRLSFLLGTVVLGATVPVLACGSDCEEKQTCGVGPTPVDGGVLDGGGDGQVPAPPGCDESADPKDAPKCVVNEYGVFVDGTSGSDTNAGTKESPLKSITAALGKLGGKPRVYICGVGPYAESVKLTSAVSLYGGFACGGWSHDGAKSKVSPSGPGYALQVENAAKGVVVSDLELEAKDAEAAGGSSIAVFLSRASQVTLRRAKVVAGAGKGGTDGSAQGDFTPANAPDGTDGAAGGGATANPSCPTSIGGAGGKDGAINGGAGQVAVVPEYPTGNTGAGGTGGGNCNAGGGGTDGSYGAAGAAGAGASTLGTLDATGWKGADGAPGGAGGNGQGGGGGAQRNAGGVGGSGGPGGCGGAGGAPGTAGGSSIAVLAFESTLLVEQSSLSAKDAGRGGNGAKGQKGQLMGNVGVKNGANACDGGFGGIGGSGGGGGGGAGGISAGILYKGPAPTIDGASLASADTHASVTVGAAGAGGGKGAGGDAAQTSAPASRAGQEGTAGAEGVAKAVMSAP